MHCRTLLLLIMLLGTVAAQTMTMQPTQLPSTTAPSTTTFGSVAGTVTALDDRPVRDASVALRNVMTGAVLTSTTVAADGSFQIINIPPGTYEVRASAGTHEAREQIEIRSTPVSIRLQLATGPREISSSGSVSVSQINIPDKARSEYVKAEESYGKNKLPEARKHLERALSMAPRFAEALTLRGILELDQGALMEALADLQQAINADPGYARAYVAQGAALNLAERFDDAIRSLQNGVRLAPDSWQAYFELSKTMLAKDQFEESLEYAAKAAAWMNDFPEIRMVKAYALFGMHRYQEAASELERFLAAEPSGPQAEYARATLNQARALLNTSAGK